MVRQQRQTELKRSQQSVQYYSDIQGQEDPILRSRLSYFSRLYPSMLIEDVALRIMPRGGADNSAFQVELVTNNEKAKELIESALPNEHYGDFTTAICGFFHDCAQSLIGFGETIYEIVTFSDALDDVVRGFELVFIQPGTLSSRWGKILQYVPEDVARECNVSRHVSLNPERILWFNLPKSTSSIFGWRMDSLAILSEKIVPDFAMDAISNPYTDALYDISEHNVWRKRAIADAGKLIGWNARGLIQEDTLEYYILHRQLLFEQFQIELRNSILATLNDGLKRAGRLVGFDAQICIKGLPTLGDVATARAELLAGSKPFKEILQPFQKI